MKERLANTHEKFIDHVKKYRSKQLSNDPDIFSGEIYSGESSLEKGLVDEIGSMVQFLSNRYPDSKLDFPDSKNNIFSKLRGW